MCRASKASRWATEGAGASATSPPRRRPTSSRIRSRVARLWLSMDSNRTLALVRVEVLAGLGGGRQLAEPLLQKAVELAGETDPVAGELQGDPLVTQPAGALPCAPAARHS